MRRRSLGGRLRLLILRLVSFRGGRWAMGMAVLGVILTVSMAVGLSLGVTAAAALFATGTAMLAALLLVVRPRWRKKQLGRAVAGLSGLTAPATEGTFVSWQAWEVEPAVRAAVAAALVPDPRPELVLGRIDGDGRLASPYGEFPGFEAVSEERFIPRRRFGLDLVLHGDRVVVRKDYRGNLEEMAHETFALIGLAGIANVPAVHRMDLKKTVLYRSFAAGDTVNDLLVRAGARIQLAQTENDPELQALPTRKRLEAVLARGTDLVPQCLSESFLRSIEDQVAAIHQRRVAGLSLTFGNLVVDTERDEPWFIDFDGARTYHPSPFNVAFLLRRWDDLAKLQRFYDREEAWGARREEGS